MALHSSEEATIRAFVISRKRDRLLALLSNPKRRAEGLDRLNHFAGWDPRWVTEIESSADVLAVLRDAGAPAKCYVIADDIALDGSNLSLTDAVAAGEACWFASVLCCEPGQIAFYFDEIASPRIRILLRRNQD